MRGFRIQDAGVRVSRESTTRRRRPFVRRRLGSFPVPRPPHPASSGVTLIELLITITILATLAALFLGASNAAMESARAARTKTTIGKIHSLLMERWASYRTRRVDVNTTSGLNSADAHKVRLDGLRELMKLEMPDRWTDVRLASLGSAIQPPTHLSNRPSLALNYLRQLDAAIARVNTITKQTNTTAEIYRNQSAECLYLLVMLATGDGEARTLFSRQDIGDTDGDGLLEFLDGWGRPIQFVRWSTGFVSDLQPLTAAGNRDPNNDHDPFDPFRVQKFAYRFVPLVFSTGPDGESGINTKDDDYVASVDPYYAGSGSNSTPPGTILNTTLAIDNIHNHLQDSR